ncbi:hypothetical protein Leryth_020613 [Lithospermum erythrorhizon]|uniref:Ribosomal protein n=1 Tax=Lithospermum erythrorhizon TaxID=34254 RepID=A0AAV3P3L0_LITER|nr:hypothetical protein Leryth_020613 [Lithospermum erythrorhizon]
MSNMLSTAVQSSISTCPSFASHKNSCTTHFKDTASLRPIATSFLHQSNILYLKCKPIRGMQKLYASAVVQENSTESVPIQEPKKISIGGKEIQKPKVVLKFIWMEKNIGLALDQELPEHGIVPLCSYFFWPRKDAWEELKTTLESKPWISQKKMIILLNQATDIINLWQQSGGNLS